MDGKQKAIEELKKQRKLARERLGPEGVQRLEKLAKGLTEPRPIPHLPPGSIPYDKKAAKAAFDIFLKNHKDPEEFERKLRALLKKKSH